MPGKIALIAGSSGLVGNLLLHQLLQDDHYDQIIVLVRRSIAQRHPKLVEVVCDFNNLEEVSSYLKVDDVFCCLGTTIKKAKTRTAMNLVDRDYPIDLAKKTFEQGAQQFIIISAPNNGEDSPFAYSKMKGQLEAGLRKIPFNSLAFIHPSLLMGDRLEFRFAESISTALLRGITKITRKPISAKLGIEAVDVATAMLKIAHNPKQGVTTYPAKKLQEIAATK